jgi:hypothetical protein
LRYFKNFLIFLKILKNVEDIEIFGNFEKPISGLTLAAVKHITVQVTRLPL